MSSGSGMGSGIGSETDRARGAATGMDPDPAGWFEQLEAQLERQLQAFLAANPAQEALLQEQEQQEKQQRLRRRRLELQGQADQARTGLLELVADINPWQRRALRARNAGAQDLADRAEHHLGQLMGQGRDRWQALAELGQAFQGVEAELEQLARQTPSPPQAPTDGVKPGRRQAAAEATGPSQQPPLDQAWAAFEAQQALEDLRRRQA